MGCALARRHRSVFVALAVIGGCGQQTPPRVPTAPPAPAAAAAGGVAAPDEEPAETPRPDVLLLVEGGPDDGTVWRGWPVFIRAVAVAGSRPATLQITGPSPVAPTAVTHGWVIPAEVSGGLAPGAYAVTAGPARIQIMVTDPPAAPTPGQQARRRQIAGWCALALGDVAGARREADAWVAAEPRAFEAHAALGEALAAARQWPEALAAYRAAINLVPKGRDPPRALIKRTGEIMQAWMNEQPARAAAAPSANENAYHTLLTAGDAARAAGDNAEAARQYAAAIALHQSLRLSVSRREADEKLASLRAGAPAPVPTPLR